MPTKTAKKPKKKSITVRIPMELFDYVESQRRGLRDRTGQIEFFIRSHQIIEATHATKQKVKNS